MTETYDAKLKRRLRVRSGFPPALQQVPVRYVDDIAALSQNQQELLCEALATGTKSLRQILKRLKELGGNATIQLLLKNDDGSIQASFDREDIEVLADILDQCFPGMPLNSATALAESPVMVEALQITKDLRVAMESENSKSDFVIVALYAAIKYAKKNIEDKIQSNPAFLQTVRTSGLVWNGESN